MNEPVAKGFIRTLVMVSENGFETWKDEPFYITAPQREWVGLTKTEFNEVTHNLEDLEDCWIAIEAKLKEKNNG